jgi:thioredoxin reductase (NADPH)
VSDIRNLIIIGSGPAGYTAAVYAARANLNPLVIEGAQSGGALMTTTEVENFPGFPAGVVGPELTEALRKQAERFGATVVAEDVTAVDLRGDPKSVRAGDRAYLARTVILATGSAWRRMRVPGEEKLISRGVSSCATCDGALFRGRRVAVVGGGDTAMEEATFLTRFAERVTIVHRRGEFRASKVMAARALSNDRIDVVWNSVVTEVVDGGGKVAGLRLRHVTTGEESILDVAGVFVAIGHVPRSDLFRGQVDLDSSGYVRVDAPGTRTSLAGVFGAGDLVDHTYRQAITAAGSGCAAALDAERYLVHR